MKAIADTLEVARSHQYETTKARIYATRPDDEKYLTMIQEITDNRPSYGYRRTTALVNRALECQRALNFYPLWAVKSFPLSCLFLCALRTEQPRFHLFLQSI